MKSWTINVIFTDGETESFEDIVSFTVGLDWMTLYRTDGFSVIDMTDVESFAQDLIVEDDEEASSLA